MRDNLSKMSGISNLCDQDSWKKIENSREKNASLWE